ncbi:hypothetical protein GQ457_15G005000 [Hibiscus cannabinus]
MLSFRESELTQRVYSEEARMSTPARKRLMRDFKRLQHDPPAGISGAPQDNNIMLWNAVIFGPDDTPWDGGTFKLTLQFTEDYPNKPPTVRFVSRMFHPNIYADGSICLDILQNQWSPIYDVAAILTSIQSLLCDPNPNSPANSEAARMFSENKREYNRRETYVQYLLIFRAQSNGNLLVLQILCIFRFPDLATWGFKLFLVLTDMGKSPAKWIKTLLLGKKPSNSDLSKGKEKLNSANNGEVLVSSKVTLSELLANPANSASDFVDSKEGTTKFPNNGTNIPSSQAVGNDNAISIFGKPEDPERIRLDRAAANAQAAVRGYLHYCLFCSVCHLSGNIGLCRSAVGIVPYARRAFRTLKSIIRLQALVRGHLVRRQAVATLCCTWGIVKFQALARGKKGLKSSDPFRVGAFSQGSKNETNNIFVQKLLASSPAVLPLRLQYGPEEPNSLWQWLRRWTSSRFWESPLPVIRSLALKSSTKQSVWKLSTAKVENGPCLTLEHEKTKCVVRKVSGNSTADTVLEHPQNELEKVKRTLKKLTAKEVSKKSEVVNDKTAETPKRTTADAPDVSEQKSDEKMTGDASATLSRPSNLEADPRLSQENASLDEPNVSPVVDLAPAENNDTTENMLVPEELSSKDKQISDVSSKKANQRRASFPAKTGNLEDGLSNMPKVPSYMSPTESVKARLRSQGSPRSAGEVVEKNGLNRRYSLPSSSTDSNLSSLSPGSQRPAQVGGKGDKMVRAEWRR